MTYLEPSTSNAFRQGYDKNTLVFVVYTAQWSSPCQALYEPLKRVASRHPNVVTMNADIDILSDVPEVKAVKAIPHAVALKNKKVVAQYTGPMTEAKIESLISSLK